MKKGLLIVSSIIFYLLGLTTLIFYMYLELAPRVNCIKVIIYIINIPYKYIFIGLLFFKNLDSKMVPK